MTSHAARPPVSSRATGAVLRELARASASRRCCQAAEVATTLRLAGACPAGAVLGTWTAAARARDLAAAAFGVVLQIRVMPGGKAPSYLVAAAPGRDADSLARQAGLSGPGGEPLSGLPPRVVAGGRCDCAAAWRGAILAAGTLSPPARARPALTVTCPARDAALALAGAARRLGITATAREHRGTSQVAVLGAEEATALLTRIGAPNAALDWAGRHQKWLASTSSGSAARIALGDANTSRSQKAAAQAATRAATALQVLGDATPAHLAAAARLRIDHPGLTLLELGLLADPPVTKNAMAGRLRRLGQMARAQAEATGVTGTGHPEPAAR